MKHQFGLRMLAVHSGQPMQKLWRYETNNQQFTLDDFVKANSLSSHYQLIFPFYIGYMHKDDVLKRYDKDLFNLNRSHIQADQPNT